MSEQAKNEKLELIFSGINEVADTVKVTIGPRGRNVVFDQKYDIPLVTNDGVTIAKQIELEDPYKNTGADLMKQAALKTNELVGDGTTTAVVLAQHMIQEGLKNVASGANPVLIKNGIEKATKAVVDVLKKSAVEVNSLDTIRYIAKISGNNDDFIGDLVAEAFEKVGFEGIVLVEDSQLMETELRYSDGIKIENGYLSEYFVNDKVGRKADLKQPYILLVDRSIKAFNDLLKMLEELTKTNRPLLIISQDTEGEALYTLAMNAFRGKLKVAAIKAPGYGDTRKRNLQALALMVNATIVTEDIGMQLRNLGLEVCGSAERVVIEKEQTVIQNPPGAGSAEVKSMVQQVKKQLAETTEDYEIEKLNYTLSILAGGIVNISVGGISELEMFERKYRLEDAIHAVYSGIAGGILPGGGTAFLHAIPTADSVISTLTGDEKTGAEIIKRALRAPLMQIAQNAGIDGDVVVNNVLEQGDSNIGFNALNLTYEDMFEAGVIDPANVIISAFESASSVAGMLLTMEAGVSGKL